MLDSACVRSVYGLSVGESLIYHIQEFVFEGFCNPRRFMAGCLSSRRLPLSLTYWWACCFRPTTGCHHGVRTPRLLSELATRPVARLHGACRRSVCACPCLSCEQAWGRSCADNSDGCVNGNAGRLVGWEPGASCATIGERTCGQTRTTRRAILEMSGRSRLQAPRTQRASCWKRCARLRPLKLCLWLLCCPYSLR